MMMMAAAILPFLMSCQAPVDSPVTIGCIPLFHAQEPDAIAAAEYGRRQLDLISGDSLRILPIERFFDVVDADSTMSASYFIRMAKRLGCDFALLFSPPEPGKTPVLQIFKTPDCKVTPFFEAHAEKSERMDSILICSFNRMFGATLRDFSSASDPSASSDPDYAVARQHQLLRNFEAALTCYRQMVMHDTVPLHIALNYVQALLDAAEEDVDMDIHFNPNLLAAEDLLRPLIRSGIESAAAWLLLARIHLYRSQWNLAENALKKCHDLDPQNPEIFFYASRLHSSRHVRFGFRRQDDLLRKAIALHPGFQKAYLVLADLYTYSGRSDQAEAVYRNLLAIHPASLDAKMALGKLYLIRREIPKMIAIYEEIFKEKPDNPDILYNLGVSYYTLDRLDQAMPLFSQAVRVYNHPDAGFYLGHVYYQKEMYEKALIAYRERVALRKGFDDIYADEALKQIEMIEKILASSHHE